MSVFTGVLSNILKIFVKNYFQLIVLALFSCSLFSMQVVKKRSDACIDCSKILENNAISFDGFLKNKKCSICYDLLKKKDIVILNCHKTHIFCLKCLNSWLLQIRNLNNQTCPLCRRKIDGIDPSIIKITYNSRLPINTMVSEGMISERDIVDLINSRPILSSDLFFLGGLSFTFLTISFLFFYLLISYYNCYSPVYS